MNEKWRDALMSKKIVMLSVSAGSNDVRIMKEAKSIANLGAQVTVIAKQLDGFNEGENVENVKVVRVKPIACLRDFHQTSTLQKNKHRDKAWPETAFRSLLGILIFFKDVFSWRRRRGQKALAPEIESQHLHEPTLKEAAEGEMFEDQQYDPISDKEKEALAELTRIQKVKVAIAGSKAYEASGAGASFRFFRKTLLTIVGTPGRVFNATKRFIKKAIWYVAVRVKSYSTFSPCTL
jgi:hypothetical protein